MCICREKCKKGCLPVCEEWYFWVVISWMGFPSGQAVKNPLDSSVPGWGRFPGEGNGNPLQCSCPGNPMDRGARAGYSPWGCNSMGYDLATQQQPWVTDILFVNEHCNFSTKNVYYIYLKNNKIVKKSDFVKCINTRLTYIKMSNRSVFSHSRPSPTCPPSGPPPHPLCVHCSACDHSCVSSWSECSLSLSPQPFAGRWADGDKPQLWCSINCDWFIYTIESFSEAFPSTSFLPERLPALRVRDSFITSQASRAGRRTAPATGRQPHGHTWEAARLSYMTLAKDGCDHHHGSVRALNHSRRFTIVNKYQVPVYLHVKRHHWSKMAPRTAHRPTAWFPSLESALVSSLDFCLLRAEAVCTQGNEPSGSPPRVWSVRPGKKPGHTGRDCPSPKAGRHAPGRHTLSLCQ